MINHNLTQREQEVLKLVAQAKTNKEIREELYIADCTLDTHLHNIYKKLGLFATDRSQTSVLRLKTAMYVWNAKQQANKEYYNQKIKKLLTENEQLKADIESRTMCITCERELQNCNLQAENERLREENEKLNNQYCLSTILKINELEQENEELKQDLHEVENACSCFESENADLRKENERLKKLKFKSDGIELLQDANLNLHNANVKYRQALQEIKEYCKEQNLKADYTACEIIDKINSVIGAE